MKPGDAFFSQYPDAWEVRQMYLFQNQDPTFCIRDENQLVKLCPAEFAFATSAPVTHSGAIAGARNLGFKPIASMNNWFSGHSSHYNKITLWWKRVHKKQVEPLSTKSRRWFVNTPYLSGSGCGFKFGDFDLALPEMTKQFFKYFSLLRLPIEPTQEQRWWLQDHHYRLVETGSLASFWCNGWDPETYDYRTIEAPFWKERGLS